MTARKAALWSIPAIGAALGVLGILHAMGPDRDAIRAELAGELVKLEAMPADDPAGKLRRAEELMAVEDYRVHAPAQRLKLERMHASLRGAAREEEEARKRVLPFLARSADFSMIPVGDLQSVFDECRALQDQYGAGRYGPALRERRLQLMGAIETARQTPPVKDPSRELMVSERERLQGRYSAAWERIDEALRMHPEEAMRTRLLNQRENILRTAKTKGEQLLAQAANDRNAESLEQALPNFKGLPEAGRIESMIRQLRGR